MTWARVGIALFVVASVLAVWPAVAPPVGALALVIAGAVRWPRAPETSPLRRGWWIVVIAGLPLPLLTVPGLLPAATRPALGVGSTLLVVLAVLLAAPARDPVEARESLVEALLAGGALAFVLAAVASAPLPHGGEAALVVAAAHAAALWLVLRFPGVRAGRGAGPPQLLAAGLCALLAVEVVVVLAPSWAAPGLTTAATALALTLWAAALSHPEAKAPPAYRARGPHQLDAGRVALVLLGVVAGPVAIAGRALLGQTPAPGLALAGGLLAVLAVVHLLQLVVERGRRAWRAQHDPLTGLPTEPLFEDRLRQALAGARRSGRGLAVAFLDLDGFKQVNDRDGHDTGDAVLRTVAHRLRSALREQDTVARRSGDEFLVLLPDVPDEVAAEIVAEKLLGALADPIVVDEHSHRIGASVGLALWPRDGDGVDDLVRHADAAMYESKDAGRGRVSWYRTTTAVRSRLRLALAQQLEDALETAALELDHQPRVDLRDGTVVGLVSLVRWRHPDLGRLMPASFLPIAEDAGIAEALDRHVLRRACVQAGRWTRMGWLDVPILVHVSDVHAAAVDLEEQVVRALAHGRLAPRRLRLGVTEAGLRRGGDVLAGNLADLAEIGVRTVVTRFGTQDAGLGRLVGLELGGLEVASAHLAALRHGDATVIETAAVLADQLGLELSGNGVDGPLELDRLRGLGARVGRGRHLARPLTKQELDERLADLARRPDHDPCRVRAADLVPPDQAPVGPEHPALAGALRDALRGEAGVEPRALDEVLRRIRPLPRER